ncbi:hypothetical protein [Streptomyces chryseus]
MSAGYQAQARLHRIGRWWAVDIPQAAVHTQCRTLDEAETMARDAVARAHGLRPDTITVELVVPEFAMLLHDVQRGVRRRRAHRATDGGADHHVLADAARTLVQDWHVSQSDAGRLLGLSHDEISRLAPPRAPDASRPWPALGPLAPPSAPASGVDRTSVSGTTGLPRHRPPSPTRPSWAIAEDDG